MTQPNPKPHVSARAVELLGTTAPNAVTVNLPKIKSDDSILLSPQTKLELELLRLFLDKGKVVTKQSITEGEECDVLCLTATIDNQTLKLLQEHGFTTDNIGEGLSNLTAVIHGICHDERNSETDGFKQVFAQITNQMNIDLIFPEHSDQPSLLGHLRDENLRPYLERAIRQDFAEVVKLAVERSIQSHGVEGWGYA